MLFRWNYTYSTCVWAFPKTDAESYRFLCAKEKTKDLKTMQNHIDSFVHNKKNKSSRPRTCTCWQTIWFVTCICPSSSIFVHMRWLWIYYVLFERSKKKGYPSWTMTTINVWFLDNQHPNYDTRPLREDKCLLNESSFIFSDCLSSLVNFIFCAPS